MRLAWNVREDVQAVYRLPEQAEDVVWWFFLHGARELRLDDLVPDGARQDLACPVLPADDPGVPPVTRLMWHLRSEEHTSELQSLMRISYAVFCLKKKKNNK